MNLSSIFKKRKPKLSWLENGKRIPTLLFFFDKKAEKIITIHYTA